jgi:hypothetical protein
MKSGENSVLLSTLLDKTPQPLVACAYLTALCSQLPLESTPFPGSSPFRVPTLTTSAFHFSQEPVGLPGFLDVSLPACHGLWTPPDLHTLALNRVLLCCLRCTLRPSASGTELVEAVPALQGARLPYGLQDALSTLASHLCSPLPTPQ